MEIEVKDLLNQYAKFAQMVKKMGGMKGLFKGKFLIIDGFTVNLSQPVIIFSYYYRVVLTECSSWCLTAICQASADRLDSLFTFMET